MSQQVVSGSLSSPLQLVSERASGPLSIAGSRSAAKWADLLSETDLTSCGGAVRIPVYTSKSQVVHAHGQQSRITTSARYCCPAFLPCRLALPLLLLLLPSLSLLRPQTRLSRHPAQLPLAQSSARDRQARVTLGLVYPKIAEPLNQQESGRRHHPCHSIYLTRCVWGKKMLRTKNSSSQSQESNKSQTPRDNRCVHAYHHHHH
jgi:hypothetical protein